MGRNARLKRERRAALQSAGLKKLPKGEHVGTLDELTDYIEKFLRHLDRQVRHRIKLDIASPPKMKAYGEHKDKPVEITKEERELLASGVSCGKCTSTKGCCYLSVSANLFEMFPIARRLRADGRNKMELIDKLWEVGMQMEDTPPEEWFDKRVPCVLLAKDERCTIYSVRPQTCRHHVVFTPPSNCSAFGSSDDFHTRTLQYNTDHEVLQCLVWNRDLCKTFFKLPNPDETGAMYAGAFPKMLARVMTALNTENWRDALAEQEWPSLSNPPNMR